MGERYGLMTGLTKREQILWAKKKTEEGNQLWLPLITHLIDTQNVINWLFNHWISDGQHQLIENGHSDEEFQKLIKFIGFFHDIGKATPAFQIKPSYNGDRSIDYEIIERLVRSGFTELDDLSLMSPSKSPHAEAGEAILENFGVPVSVGAIIGGHHGKPLQNIPKNQINDYTANYYQSDIDRVAQKRWKQTQADIFKYGLKSSGYENVDQIISVDQPQAVLLEGLLIMADWLASSEYLNDDRSKPLFPLIKLNQSCSDIDMSNRFESAIETWNLSDKWEPEMVLDDDSYKSRWGFNARPIQKVMTSAIQNTDDPGIIIIEAPMGIGKTEIALIAAEQLAFKTGEDGVFIGLPTQATTNAMFNRVNDWLEKLAENQSENFSIKLMHGKAQFNKNYQNLPSASNINDADDLGHTGSVIINSWFSGKKSILTKFTVGTIDNLLLLGLKQKHLFLKHLGLSGKVVIIDEAHAYNSYMDQYLYKVINWLGAYHVPIVILSATLPKEKRNQLLIAYLKGKFGRKYKQNFKASKDWQTMQAYPLLSLLDGDKLMQVSNFPGQSDQLPSKLRVERLNLDDQALVLHILNKISSGGVAGVIVNTVKRAQQLAKLVPKDTEMMLIHSAFLSPEREKQEEVLQSLIGKHGQRPSKMIVVGTQVLEQSLDIDFDILYTDIAPMDLILQRVGRLHRHQINRPQSLEMPRLYVMGINSFGDYGDANQSVYPKYLLLKTDYFLKNEITLPNDISKLVQKVYDPQNDNQITGISDAKAEFDNNIEIEKHKANVFQIDKPNRRESATIHGWLNRSQVDVDKDEQKANAAVRDIKETLEVILLKHTKKGDFLLDGRRLADTDPQEIDRQTIRIPAAVTPRIDKAIDTLENLTSKYYPQWQESKWLKGALALPLDEKLSAKFDKWTLKYSSKFGLSYEKEDKDD